MDFQELNQDRKIVNVGNQIDNIIDKGFSEKAKSVVNNHALIAGVILALPAFGFDNILYAIVLWDMYSSLCKLAGRSFRNNLVKSFVGGFIVNLIVTSIIELMVSFIPIANFILAFAIGYLSIKFSGAAYLKVIETMHGGNVNERYNISKTFD